MFFRCLCLNKYVECLCRWIEINVFDKFRIFYLKLRKNVSYGFFIGIDKKWLFIFVVYIWVKNIVLGFL